MHDVLVLPVGLWVHTCRTLCLPVSAISMHVRQMCDVIDETASGLDAKCIGGYQQMQLHRMFFKT